MILYPEIEAQAQAIAEAILTHKYVVVPGGRRTGKAALLRRVQEIIEAASGEKK